MPTTDEILAGLLSRYGGPPSVGSYGSPATPVYGTQAAPLDSFEVEGRTGNKTTNKDLPEWLRRLGMKGDAYAGGMLKPQIRYGFWYKDGKINFADGTSYKAKKNKDGSYSYTDGSGTAQTYSPTDEQNAYNKAYKKSTSNQSFLDKATNAVRFELDHGKQIIKGFKPQMAVFGVDPIGVKIGNTVTGRDDKPLVDQFGGALPERYADYEERTGRSTGYANSLQDVAHVIAQMYGAKGVGNAAGNAFSGPEFASLGRTGGAAAAGGGAISEAGAMGGSVGGSGAGGMPAAGGSSWMDWIPSLISAGSSIIGGNAAANAATAGSKEAIGESRRQFDLVRGDTAAQRALGNAAIARLAAVNGYDDGTPDMTQFTESPDYQFNRDEILRATERSTAANTGLISGASQRAIQRNAGNLATREYGAFVDRLLQQAGVGATGIGASAAAGANTASNVGSAAINAGNARASIYNNTAANMNNSIQTGYQNQLLRRYLGS